MQDKHTDHCATGFIISLCRQARRGGQDPWERGQGYRDSTSGDRGWGAGGGGGAVPVRWSVVRILLLCGKAQGDKETKERRGGVGGWGPGLEGWRLRYAP